MIGDPVLTRRLGFAVSRRAGLVCLSSTKLAGPLFNHVTGYGTFAAASQPAVDAVIRHYEHVGAPARIEVLHPAVRRADVRLLEKSGFRLVRVVFDVNVRATRVPPRIRDVPGLRVTRASRADAARYARLATRGFGGGRGTIAQVFERGWIRQLRHGTRAIAFIGTVDGSPAATGVLLRGPAVCRSLLGQCASAVSRPRHPERDDRRALGGRLEARRPRLLFDVGLGEQSVRGEPARRRFPQALRGPSLRTRALGSVVKRS